MTTSRTTPVGGRGRWRLGVGVCGCLTLALGLTAAMATGLVAWARGGLALAALVLLAAGGGLLMAHLMLDERRQASLPRRVHRRPRSIPG